MLKADWEKYKKDMDSIDLLMSVVELVEESGGVPTRARMNTFTYRNMFPTEPRPVSFNTPQGEITIEVDPMAPNGEVYID